MTDEDTVTDEELDFDPGEWEEIEALEIPTLPNGRRNWPRIYERLRAKAREIASGRYGPSEPGAKNGEWSGQLRDICRALKDAGLHKTKWEPKISWTNRLHEIGPEDKPWAKLIGTITIFGVDHHIEAFAVVTVPDPEAVCTPGCGHKFDDHCEDKDLHPELDMTKERGACHFCGCPGFSGEHVPTTQEAVAPEHCNFDELSEIAQGAMQTVTINHREYVMLVTPFQS